MRDAIGALDPLVLAYRLPPRHPDVAERVREAADRLKAWDRVLPLYEAEALRGTPDPEALRTLADLCELDPTLTEGARAQKLAARIGAWLPLVADTGSLVIIEPALRDRTRVDSEEAQAIDLHQSLDTTLSLIAHLTQPKIDVGRRYGDLPAVSVRPNQLNQVLMNLLVNACQAMGDHGTLTVTTSSFGDEIELRVADTGVGIPSLNLAKIFDPGFTTKGPAVGTGLGLAIAYQIITEHGGQIVVDSEPGRGSEFTVRLPVHRPARVASAPPL